MKRSVPRVRFIENTPRACLLILLGVLALAPAAWAGIADSPLPVLVVGKKTFHVYSVPSINPGSTGHLSTFFSCTSTDTAAIQVGVECFGSSGGVAYNDAMGTSLSVGPGATVTFATHSAAGIERDSELDCFVKGSARILATSKKLICTAFVADENNDPPAAAWQLTITKKTTQKGD